MERELSVLHQRCLLLHGYTVQTAVEALEIKVLLCKGKKQQQGNEFTTYEIIALVVVFFLVDFLYSVGVFRRSKDSMRFSCTICMNIFLFCQSLKGLFEERNAYTCNG